MLPSYLIPAHVARGVLVPGFLRPQDVPWLTVLIREVERYAGRPRRELLERMQLPLPCAAPRIKSRAAAWVLLQSWKGIPSSPLNARSVRADVFVTAATGLPRGDVLAAVAAGRGVEPPEIERALFADLPRERVVQRPAAVPSPEQLVLDVNLAIASSLLMRADDVVLTTEGTVRPVLRQAKLRGLLCAVLPSGGTEVPRLELSGPMSLIGPTLLYGRALASLLPALPWSERFDLEAHCRWHGTNVLFRLSSGAAIFPSRPPKPFEGRVDERFARDFLKLAPAWDLLREPEPLAVTGGVIFPDFVLQHRLIPERRWLLEIVGFWTPDYVERKLRQYREAGACDVILAIDDQRRCCSNTAAPPWARVIRYRRRLEASAVLAAMGEPVSEIAPRRASKASSAIQPLQQ